jgi:hypothetical protein
VDNDDVDVRADALDDAVDGRRRLDPAEVGALDPVKTS